MPILAEETSVFPCDLLDTPVDVTGDRQWSAIYTKARQEKALARDLFHQEIPFYLPLIPQDRLISGRTFTSFKPLFDGYVFLWATDDERVQAWKTNRISRALPISDPVSLCDDLRQVRDLIESGAPLSVERRLQAGQQVRVKCGPFADVTGTVIRRLGKRRLQVAVRFLQQGVSLELNDVLLEPV